MALRNFTVRAPASTSNLGPGFDAFGLALNLWNEVDFSFDTDRTEVTFEGFGTADALNRADNLILRAFRALCTEQGKEAPDAIRIHCRNRIPLGSGLGSSGASIAIGLVAANEALDLGLSQPELVDLGARIEAHPDNIAASLLGGLTVGAIGDGEEGMLIASYAVDDWNLAVVKPHITIFTEDARRVLPKTVSLTDAVYNIQRIPFLLSALCGGDEATLRFAARDRLHQDYRLPLIPGGRAVLDAAETAGAAAAIISGSGPTLLAFTMGDTAPILDAMTSACRAAGTDCDAYTLKVTTNGAEIVDSVQ